LVFQEPFQAWSIRIVAQSLENRLPLSAELPRRHLLRATYRQAEETMDTLYEGAEGLYKAPYQSRRGESTPGTPGDGLPQGQTTRIYPR
jgi:hypothetical protein